MLSQRARLCTLVSRLTGQPACLPACLRPPAARLPHAPPPAVEAFEPRTGTWRPKAPMQQCRAYSAVGYTGGALVALGGMRSTNHNEIVER